MKKMSTPYMPQQNGVMECANRTIVETGRNMLYAKNLNKSFWMETVANVIYTRNRCPTRHWTSLRPEEAWSSRKPYIAHMRVFGCVAYAMVLDEKLGKLDTKGTKCLFLGYNEGTKVFMLM